MYFSHIIYFWIFYGPETNERDRAYCAVRNESLNIPRYVSFLKKACGGPGS